VRAEPEPVEEAGAFVCFWDRDHLTRFAALTDLSPRGGEVIRPKNFSSPGGEVGEGGARTGWGGRSSCVFLGPGPPHPVRCAHRPLPRRRRGDSAQEL